MNHPSNMTIRTPAAGLGAALTAALLILSTLLADPVMAQSRVATTAAQFLTIGTGARGSAVGHAYTAVATGADALYWNPAGAARVTDPSNRGSVFFSRTQYLVDTGYSAFGMVLPVGSHTIGLSLAQMDYGRMDVRTPELPEGTGESFGANEFVVGMSYARPLTSSFYLGGTFKFVRQAIYDMTASTAAFDIGFVLETDYINGARIAASIMNFGGLMQMDGINARVFVDIDEGSVGSNDVLPAELETGEWPLPLSFKFGVALPVVASRNMRLELFNDIHQTNDNSLNSDTGAEVRFIFDSVHLDLRTGYKDLAISETDSHWTFGGGVDLSISGVRFGADYAYVPFDLLGDVSTIDLKFRF